MSIAIYLRTSTEDQNPENQLKDCLTLTSEQQYEVYRDQQSAWKDTKDRPDFERLKKDIQSRKINLLIVWDLDRLFRNRLKLKEFLQSCKMFKCNILSFRQQFLNNIAAMPEPFNEMMFDFMVNWFGWLAEDESKKKSDRVKISVRKKDGVTISYKGNKWGRKQLSAQKRNLLTQILSRKERPTMRLIAQELGVSVGVVHKYIKNSSVENIENTDVQELVN